MTGTPNGAHSSSPPYLSVVVTARNDDHGGNLLQRMQAFVNGFLGQCRRHQLSAELIIVEWNPPEGRPRLAQALEWPSTPDFCAVRIIEVPPELHGRYQHHKALPLYQMIAKNIGIRRAHGDFILATNIDILFSDELIAFIAQRKLRLGRMYRIDRWDVMPDVPVDGSVEEQLEYCRSHLIRVNCREGTFRLAADGRRVLDSIDIADPEKGLTLGTGWFPREMSGDEPFRWVDNNAELVIPPSRDLARVLLLDVEPGPGVNMGTFLLEILDETGGCVSSAWVTRRNIVTLPVPASITEPVRIRLHTKRGGMRISSDPRTLNFRVFRCEVERASRVAELLAKAAPQLSVTTPQGSGARAKRGFRLLRDIWRGTPGVEIRVPMSPEKLDKLKLRQDDTGVSFSAEPLRAVLRRWAQGESSGEAKIVGPGLNVLWSAGWYPVESFSGDTFRWAKNGSSLVVLSGGGATELSLLIESGPALGHKPFELEVRDQSGAAIATAQVKGRTEVKVPLPGGPGAFPLSLHARGGGPPREVPGDTRELVFRLFRCRLDESAGNAKAQELVPVEIGFPGSGVWRTRGWSEFSGPDGRRWLAAGGEAELVLQCPEGSMRKPILSVATGPGAGDGAIELNVLDPAGNVLYRGDIAEHHEVQVDGVFRGGNFYSLRLRMGHSGGTDRPEGPLLLLAAITWSAEESGEAVQVFVEPSAASRRVNLAAVHLHTNGCGDFTLIGREHWMDLRGYPEFDLFSMNIDSVFCWAAHHGGAREEVLPDPMRIYHIEHGSGSGWTPEGQQKLFQRIAAKGLSWLDYEDVLHWARIMNRFDAPMIFNHHDWGLAGEKLQEFSPWSAAEASVTVRPELEPYPSQ